MATERVDSVGIGARAGAGVLGKELATTGLRVVLFERSRHTLEGFFGDPKCSGNRDRMRCKTLKFEL